MTDWFTSERIKPESECRARTPREQQRRLTVLALRAAQSVGTSDLLELREHIKDLAAKEHLPYNGVLIDSAIRRAVGIRGKPL